MQTDWEQAFLFPLITGIIAGIIPLLIEYFAILPWLRYRETHVEKISGIDPDKNRAQWSDGIRNAIVHFKKLPNPYIWNGFSAKYNFVSIPQMNIGRGQAELSRGLAELRLSITERYVLDFLSRPKEIAKYKMIINRVGDIYQLDPIDVKKGVSEIRVLPFPFSWVVIAAILVAVVYSQLPKTPPVNKVNGLPVADLWARAAQVTLNTPVNGTIGGGEVDSYTFISNAGTIITIKLVAINEFRCSLRIYNSNNLLVDGIYLSYIDQDSMSFAPELNNSYLIVISPLYSDVGGSYTISITTANSAP